MAVVPLLAAFPATAQPHRTTVTSATEISPIRLRETDRTRRGRQRASSSLEPKPGWVTPVWSRPGARRVIARIVQRSLFAEYLEKVRGYHGTEAYQKAMRKRQVRVETLFAEAKVWHGLRRFRLRGLMNANMQGPRIATGQNLKRLLAVTGWGRRNAPCGSLVALPRESYRPSAVSG